MKELDLVTWEWVRLQHTKIIIKNEADIYHENWWDHRNNVKFFWYVINMISHDLYKLQEDVLFNFTCILISLTSNFSWFPSFSLFNAISWYLLKKPLLLSLIRLLTLRLTKQVKAHNKK